MKSLIRFQLLALFILLFFSNCPAADWEHGVALYNKGDYRPALSEFQDIVSHRPDSAGAWYYIGLCEFKLKRYKKVELPLLHAIDLLSIQSPGSPELEGAWYTIGFSYYLLEEHEKAIGPFKQYLSLVSKNGRTTDPSARRALGRSYYSLGLYDDAAPLLAANNPDKSADSAADSFYLGAIYYKRGEDDKAIIALRDAAAGKPDDPAALELLAECLMRKARVAGSVVLWSEAAQTGEKLKSIRDDLRTANVLGRAYLGAQQFDKAAGSFGKLAAANPEDGQIWTYYGIALSRSGQTRHAIDILEKTIEKSPQPSAAYYELAYIYESSKQYEQALRVYEKAQSVIGEKDPTIKQSIERLKALMASP